MSSSNKVGITEVVLRDGIQSLLATRVPLRDLVPIIPVLDKIGYWSMETWGGATYDACIRYCLLYTSPSPRDVEESRMPSSA